MLHEWETDGVNKPDMQQEQSPTQQETNKQAEHNINNTRQRGRSEGEASSRTWTKGQLQQCAAGTGQVVLKQLCATIVSVQMLWMEATFFSQTGVSISPVAQLMPQLQSCHVCNACWRKASGQKLLPFMPLTALGSSPLPWPQHSSTGCLRQVTQAQLQTQPYMFVNYNHGTCVHVRNYFKHYFSESIILIESCFDHIALCGISF